MFYNDDIFLSKKGYLSVCPHKTVTVSLTCTFFNVYFQVKKHRTIFGFREWTRLSVTFFILFGFGFRDWKRDSAQNRGQGILQLKYVSWYDKLLKGVQEKSGPGTLDRVFVELSQFQTNQTHQVPRQVKETRHTLFYFEDNTLLQRKVSFKRKEITRIDQDSCIPFFLDEESDEGKSNGLKGPRGSGTGG